MNLAVHKAVNIGLAAGLTLTSLPALHGKGAAQRVSHEFFSAAGGLFGQSS